jgi:general nucleoside transport system ATP-binding protein
MGRRMASPERRRIPSDAPTAIELRNIDKHFGSVHANRGVSLQIKGGTIHGIIGENGAGKSTLMSILYGFYRADAGEILINGSPVTIRSPAEAIALGIGMVHQHFMLVENFTVLENIVLGAEGGPILNRGFAEARNAVNMLKRDYGLDVPAGTLISDLPVGLQQRVEILKALYRQAEILILDEPTGVLTPKEADHLFAVLRKLRDEGKTLILITHKLREVMAVTDSVSVMRKGELVATLDTRSTTPAELAALMVGRSVSLTATKSHRKPGRCVLELCEVSYTDAAGVERLKNISFALHEGEILGIAGVAGNGQSELLEVVSGMLRPTAGDILLHGKSCLGLSAKSLRKRGVAHVPEDRQHMGLVMSFEACENVILGYHDRAIYGSFGLLNRQRVIDDARKKMHAYDVRPPLPLLYASLFSGGNQQKLVLAREIDQHPDILIVGQPTRGVDIGAIEFIHQRLIELRDRGKAILLVSVELDEIRSLSDRILTMCNGLVVGECTPAAAESAISLMMAGISPDKAA